MHILRGTSMVQRQRLMKKFGAFITCVHVNNKIKIGEDNFKIFIFTEIFWYEKYYKTVR